MSRGIVVRHKENWMQYAISEDNFNPKVHRKIRDLTAKESVRSYKPRQAKASPEPAPVAPAPQPTLFSMGNHSHRLIPTHGHTTRGGHPIVSKTEAPVAGATDKKKEG